MKKCEILLNYNKIIKLEENYFIGLFQANILDKNIPLDPNPRTQKLKGDVYKQIEESLKKDGAKFELLNRGITICLSRINIIENNNIIRMGLEENNGIIDGGHTYKAIINNQDYIEDSKFVKIEFLVGLNVELINKVAEARNISQAVSDITIANSKNQLDFIKIKLESENFYKYICWKQNEINEFKNNINLNKYEPIKIEFLIQLFTIFNCDKYKSFNCNDDNHPIISYNAQSACTKLFLDSLDYNNNPYKKMQGIMLDIIKLYCYINDGIIEVLKINKNRLTETQDCWKKSKKLQSLPYENKDKIFSPGFIFPIINIFRSFIAEKNNEYIWNRDIYLWWNSNKVQIIQLAYLEYYKKEKKMNINQFGKSVMIWSSLYNHFSQK